MLRVTSTELQSYCEQCVPPQARRGFLAYLVQQRIVYINFLGFKQLFDEYIVDITTTSTEI